MTESIFGWMGVEGFFAERRGESWFRRRQTKNMDDTWHWFFDVLFLGGCVSLFSLFTLILGGKIQFDFD